MSDLLCMCHQQTIKSRRHSNRFVSKTKTNWLLAYKFFPIFLFAGCVIVEADMSDVSPTSSQQQRQHNQAWQLWHKRLWAGRIVVNNNNLFFGWTLVIGRVLDKLFKTFHKQQPTS